MRRTSNTKHILNTIFISGIGVVISYLINLFLTSYITESLGIEAYGFVTLSKTFVGYAGMITIALTSFIVRYISVSYHAHNLDDANSYFSSSITACIFLCAILAAIAGAAIFELEYLINIPDELVTPVKILFVFIFASFFVTTISSPYTAAAFIKNKLDIIGIFKIVSYLIEAGILVLLFYLYVPNVWFVGLGSFCAAATLLFGNLFLTRRYTPELKFDKRLVALKRIKNLLSNGIWNSLNQLGNELNSGLDLLISNLMLSSLATGQISVAKSIGMIFSTLNTTLAQPFQPGLLKAYSEKNTEKLMQEIRKTMRISGYFSAVCLAGFVALGRLYMSLWLPGQDYEYLYILSVVNIGFNLTAGVMQPIYFINTLTLKNKVPCIVTICGGAVNVAAMYLLLKYTELGAISIVVTTTVIMLCINLFFNPIYSAKCLGVKPTMFYAAIMRHILAVLVLIWIFAGVERLLTPHSWSSLLGTAVVMAGIALPIYAVIVGGWREMFIKKYKRVK